MSGRPAASFPKFVREKAEIITTLTLDDDYETIWEYYSDDAKGKVLKEDFIEDMTGIFQMPERLKR